MCDKHPPFSLGEADRAKRTFAEAIDLAQQRASQRGIRQRVVRHSGHIFKRGVWFVQDVRRTPVAS